MEDEEESPSPVELNLFKPIYHSDKTFVYKFSNPKKKMAPATRPDQIGPHPSYIQVAKPFIFQQEVEGQLVAIGANPTREDTFRLQGVQWIDDVRTALFLPIRTFDTACISYHKFRLVHKDNEYQFQDAAAAALLTACKIEDTLKKSKEILCAAHNLKVGTAEQLSPDDNVFESPSKIVIGLERLMLESSSFDFRGRYPQKHLIKLGKAAGIEQSIVKVAYNIMSDLYRTFTPLKQTCATMSFACLELATYLVAKQQDVLVARELTSYKKWHTTRAEVIETIFDLLEHYTHFQKFSIVGPSYPIEKFIDIRIKINQEMEQDPSLNRYTFYFPSAGTNGFKFSAKTPKTPITPASPTDTRTNGKDGASPGTLSPRSSGSGRRGIGARGQEGTIRFILDAEKAKKETETVNEYYKVEYEEYEIEVEEPIRNDRNDRGGPRDRGGGRDFYNHQNKRGRR